MNRFFAALLSIGLLSAQGADAGQEYRTPVTSDFSPGTVDWSDGYSKAYTFVWGLTAIEGEVAVCGVGQYRDPTTMLPSKKMMRKAIVDLNGKMVLMDLSFFANVPVTANLMTAEAICRKTGVPVTAAKGQFGLTIPSGKARF